MGRNRSPVTNSLLEDTSVERLVNNLAVSGMANMHREKLGRVLLNICAGVKRRGGQCGDGGVRIEGLVDAGADVNVRGVGGNTPLHLVNWYWFICFYSVALVVVLTTFATHFQPIIHPVIGS